MSNFSKYCRKLFSRGGAAVCALLITGSVAVAQDSVSTTTHRILGAHIIGEQALEVLHLMATAMAGDMQVEQLAEMELAYPTFTAMVGLAARRILRDLGNVRRSSQVPSGGQVFTAEWERGEA